MTIPKCVKFAAHAIIVFYPDGDVNDRCLYLLALKRLQEYENVMFSNEGDEVISLTDLILLREIIGRE